MPNHTFTRLGQLILVGQKRTGTNNAYNFILYNSSSMHNCMKTYNNKKKICRYGTKGQRIYTVPLTIGKTVLKESDDFVILGVTFDSNMTLEKHLRSESGAAAQRLGILRKSWRVFHDRSLLVRCLFRGFVLPDIE